MPDRFNRPHDPADALYHDVLCGDVAAVAQAIEETPHLVRQRPVIEGAWSHGGRRCGATDDVITCLHLIIGAGATFKDVGVGTFDSAFKTHPRAARLLFDHGANVHSADKNGKTGLHAMAEIGFRSAMEFLLSRGADVNARTTSGKTPLDISVSLGARRLSDFLRDFSLDNHSPTSEDTPLQASAPMRRGSEDREGTVMWFRRDRGYGYLVDRGVDGKSTYGELFFEREQIVGAEPAGIEEGTPARFRVAHDRFGLMAVAVSLGEQGANVAPM